MYSGFAIAPPFFEVGPKAYLYGDGAVDLAVFADSLIPRYGVEIIFTAQYTDIAPVCRHTKHLRVFAQHMDPIEVGKGIGAVLPEAVRAAGAEGVLLNHAEKPMELAALSRAIRRADTVGLASLVCAGDATESAAAACLGPNIVLAESPLLIGAGKRSPDDAREIERINRAVRSIAPGTPVLHAAGIADERDVYSVIAAGADATGSTSGILRAPDPMAMLEKMIAAVRDAWDHRAKGKDGAAR